MSTQNKQNTTVKGQAKNAGQRSSQDTSAMKGKGPNAQGKPSSETKDAGKRPSTNNKKR